MGAVKNAMYQIAEDVANALGPDLQPGHDADWIMDQMCEGEGPWGNIKLDKTARVNVYDVYCSEVCGI